MFHCHCHVVRLEESKKRNLKLQEELRESRRESEMVKQRYEEEVAGQSHGSPGKGGRPRERSVMADHVISFLLLIMSVNGVLVGPVLLQEVSWGWHESCVLTG